MEPDLDRITLPDERAAPSAARPLRAPSTRDALGAGLHLAVARASSREARVIVVFALSFAAVAGLIERRVASLGAPDRAVIPVFRFVLPLAVVAWIRVLSSARRLGDAMWAIARFGLETRLVALGALVGGAVFALVIGALVAFTAAVASGAPAADVLVTVRLGAETGPVYAALGAAAATLPVRRAGLYAAVADGLLWGGASAPFLALPGAHVRSLVGVGPAGGLSQAQSSAALLALFLLLGALACARTGPGQREG